MGSQEEERLLLEDGRVPEVHTSHPLVFCLISLHIMCMLCASNNHIKL